MRVKSTKIQNFPYFLQCYAYSSIDGQKYKKRNRIAQNNQKTDCGYFLLFYAIFALYAHKCINMRKNEKIWEILNCC